jgi:acid phosphatase (class A)
MKINHISEGHWEIAPEEYPNSILPNERKAKRHGTLAYPKDRKRFIKNMGLAENKDDIKYDGTQMEPELASKPTPDFQESWKQIKLPEPPSNSSSVTEQELESIKSYIAEIDKKKRAEISAQDIPDLEDLFFDILDKHDVKYSHKLYNHACDIVEQLSTIGMHFKQIYNRARPKQLLPDNIADKIVGGKTAKSASYPSTHAIIGAVMAGIFSKLYPKHADEFNRLGKSLGINRIEAGYHFRSDYNAGVHLADRLLKANLDTIVKRLKKDR